MSACSRWIFAAISMIALTIGFEVGSVDARPERPGQIPNGNVFSCANCHVNPAGGGPRNVFGQAIESGFLNGSGASATVNWNATIAGMDSDGDGVSNGDELGDPDGDGIPTPGVTVTLPGDATSFNVQQPPPPTDDRDDFPEVAEGDILVLVDGEELASDEANDPIEVGVREFALVFGVPIEGQIVDGDLDLRNLGIRISPEEIAESAEARISSDGLALVVTIDVPANTIFELIIGRYPGNPDNRALTYFIGTIELPAGSIAGSVAVDEGLDPIVGGVVTLLTADALDVLMEDGDVAGFRAGQVRLDEDLAFSFRFLSDGDYILLARGLRQGEVDTEDDRGDETGDSGIDRPRPLRAFFDADEDGVPDIVSVAGQPVEGVDIIIRPPPAPVPLQIASLEVAGQTIEEGVSNDSIPSGSQEILVTFNQAVERRPDDTGDIDLPFRFDLFPSLGDDVDPGFSLSDDGTSLSGTLDFPADATFQLVFGGTRIGGENRQNFFFGTMDLPSASVSGTLSLPDAIDALPDRSSGVVVLVSTDALAEVREELTGESGTVDGAGKQAVLSKLQDDGGGELMPADDDPDLQVGRVVRQAIRLDVPNLDLGFDLRFVPDGTYLIGSSTQTVGPDGQPRRLVGFYDPDGTGTPAEVVVSGGSVSGLSIALTAPAPPPPRLRLGDLLTALFPRLESGELEFLDIQEILPGLNEDDRRRLRQIAGEDGLLVLDEVRRVLGIQAPQAPAALVGQVTDVNEDESFLVVQDADGVDWTVLVGSDTALEITGEQNVLGGDQPQGGQGSDQPPATKQGQPDQPGQGGGNQGGGDVDRTSHQGAGGGQDSKGPKKQRQTRLRDLAVGVQVEVFGEVVDELTIAASRIVIQGGGIVRITFMAEGEIAFFDPFSLSVEFRNGQVIEVTRNTLLTGPDGEPREPSDLIPGTRVAVTGVEATRGRRTTLVAETIQIIGGRPFRVQGTVASVDGRTITLQPRTPEPIDPRAQFGNARGRRVSLEEFQTLLENAVGLEVLVKLNRFGTGIIGMQIYDPRQKKPIKDDERLFDVVTISVETIDDILALVFQAPPLIEVPEGTPIRGDADAEADLSALLDKRVVVDGEASEGVLTALGILVVRSVDRIDVTVEVGDFDGQGVDNDARITVLDPDGVELENTIQVALDRERPVEGLSGDTKNNLRPGKHRVQVRVPDLPGVEGRAEFLIRDKGPGLEVTETFPADGDVGVSESTELAITFSGPIQLAGRFVNVTAFLRPGPNSGLLRGFELSDDGQTIFLPVVLEPETTYTLQIVSAVSETRQAVRRPISISFSTGGSVEAPATVSGSVGLVARTKQAEAIEILSGEVIAVDSDGVQGGRGAVETDGTFEVSGLAAGTYQLFATLETSNGGSSGFLDEDGNGVPDDVVVASGQTITGLAITVQEPLVLEEVVVEDVIDSPVTLDLDVTAGDQDLTFLAGEPGGEIDVAVYLTGAVDLLGFDLLLEFDPTALTFVEVLEDGEADEDLNIMKVGGGFALGILRPSSSSINWSVAILGPTDEQLGQGDGLLGIFRFTVNESFFGATDISISQLVQESSSAGATVIQPFVSAQVDGEGVTSQIIASAADASVSASGGQTTINADLADLDGLVFTDDSTTELTFTVESGDATVNDESEVIVAVSSGQVAVTLIAQGSGTIGVRITADGASSVLIEVSAPGLGEGEVGPIALDANTDAGDQEERILPGEFSAGDQVTIDIAAISGADGEIGFQVLLSFDPAQLSFVDFGGTDLMASAVPITNEVSEDVIELNAAILGGQASGDSGSLGQATFEVLDGFTGQTNIELISGSFAEEVSIGFGGAVIQIGGSAGDGSGEATADFDGDGVVGFSDFIAFAGVFGATSTSDNWDPSFDLDADGAIGFGDFIAFAGVFGQTVKPALAKPLGVAPVMNQDASIVLKVEAGETADEVVVLVGVVEAESVQGYYFRMDYDTSVLQLLTTRSVNASLFATGDEPALRTDVPEGLVVADVLADATFEAENGLVEMRFRVLDQTERSPIDVIAMVSDPRGGVAELAGARFDDVRAIPTDYGLSQNFPNPFNPETQIAFQVPESGNLSLVVYNTLGQQVRVLEQGPVEAGFHRIVWDGRDAVGRNVSSGVYLVRMKSGSFNSIKKMLLLK